MHNWSYENLYYSLFIPLPQLERLHFVLLKETQVIVFLVVTVVEGFVVALVVGEELSIPLRHGCPEWKEYVQNGQ